MLKRITLICSFAICSITSSFSQTFEVGFFMGASNYMGDLQPEHITADEFRLSMGINGRYNFTPYLSAKVGFLKGQISGDDRHSTVESGRKERNLHFESKIMELNILAECHFLGFLFDERPIISPYIYAGVAGFHFNPKAVYDNQVIDLQPLGTEGQGANGTDKYSLYQVAIPFGFGTEINVGNACKIGIDVGVRKTFTDYLDDVSTVYPDIELLNDVALESAALSYRTPEYNSDLAETNPIGNVRGNPNNKDWYAFGGMTFSFNISALTELGGGPGMYNPF